MAAKTFLNIFIYNSEGLNMLLFYFAIEYHLFISWRPVASRQHSKRLFEFTISH